MPTLRLMMNSSRARPTPSFGSRWNSNASSGLPTFIMIFVGDGGMRSSATSTISIVEQPLVDVAGVALGAGDRDLRAFAQHLRRVAAADDRRNAELARDDRRVAGAPAAVGDDRRRALHHRLPIGIGHLGDEHVAGLHALHLGRRLDEAHATLPDLLADRASGREHRPTSTSADSGCSDSPAASCDFTVSGRACRM